MPGVVEPNGLGIIVGSSTAGTNGVMNRQHVLGGYSVSFTAMRVLRYDGTPLDGVGILPHVPAEPTGILAGPDEVVERGLQVVKRHRR